MRQSQEDVREFDWEALAELDTKELLDISELVTSIAFYPWIFFGTWLSSVVYPIWALLKFFSGDFRGAWELIWVNLMTVWIKFLTESWRIPASWFYQGYAISYNLLYILYLVWLELMRVAWVFFKVYLNWLFDLFNLTLEFVYDMMYWIANMTYWLPYYAIKLSIVFLQWTFEVTYDILRWSWTTFVRLINWTIDLVIAIFKISIIVPVWLVGKSIVIHEWATLFVWKYDEYIASSLFSTDFT